MQIHLERPAPLGGHGRGSTWSAVPLRVVLPAFPAGHGLGPRWIGLRIHMDRRASPAGHGHGSTRTAVPLRLVMATDPPGAPCLSGWSWPRIHPERRASPAGHGHGSIWSGVPLRLVTVLDPCGSACGSTWSGVPVMVVTVMDPLASMSDTRGHRAQEHDHQGVNVAREMGRTGASRTPVHANPCGRAPTSIRRSGPVGSPVPRDRFHHAAESIRPCRQTASRPAGRESSCTRKEATPRDLASPPALGGTCEQ
jgi:hypothetical protein